MPVRKIKPTTPGQDTNLLFLLILSPRTSQQRAYLNQIKKVVVEILEVK